LAKADASSTSAVIGLTNTAIANGAIGYVTSNGAIDGVNTGSYTVGQVLYLSPYSAGQLQNTVPPTGLIVQVGVVSYSNASGSIYVKQTQPLILATTQGGTGLSSYTAGDLTYYASGTTFTKLGIGTAGQILTSSGTAPQWSTLTGVAVTTFSGGTTGLTPNTATSGAITLAGTLITTNGGTGLSSYTAGDLLYYATGSVLSKLGIGTSNYVLTSSGTAPQYVAQSTLSVGTATNVAGGTAGAVPYQSGAGATTFLSIGTAGQILTVNAGATAPQYVSSLTTAQGGTGLTSFTAGDLVYFSTGTTFTKLGIGTAGQVLTVNAGATAPQWSTTAASGVTSISFGSTGLTPNTASTGAVTVAGTLALASGGTGATTVAAAQTNLQVDPAGTAVAMAIALG
jgi:hypothetical protein